MQARAISFSTRILDPREKLVLDTNQEVTGVAFDRVSLQHVVTYRTVHADSLVRVDDMLVTQEQARQLVAEGLPADDVVAL